MEQRKKPARISQMHVVKAINPEKNIFLKSKLFTTRQAEVLYMFSKAYARKNIASALDIKVNTVDKHINQIHIKTNIHSVAELMNWCVDFQRSVSKK